ncbi:MAG TPA: nucleoside recognition domain-containing protein [Bacteroidota bacterium]
MLNYIWLSLIALAIVAAVGNDIKDEVENTYRNGIPMDATVLVRNSPGENTMRYDGEIVIGAQLFDLFYGVQSQKSEVHQPVSLTVAANGAGSLYMPMTDASPEFWKQMSRSATARDRLTGKVLAAQFSPDRSTARVTFILESIKFVKIRAVTQAALDFAGTAVEISIGLIGIMALWLGLMKIAEEAGFIGIVTRMLAPVTRRLFPEVPPDHPAVGAMMMNIAANMLGLNNAATPLGLKAMEELNKLNPKAGTATNAMVTFLTINTGGLILIPATAIAVRAASGSTNPGIIIGTSIVGASCATIAGVLAAKLLQRLPRYKKDLEVRRD